MQFLQFKRKLAVKITTKFNIEVIQLYSTFENVV